MSLFDTVLFREDLPKSFRWDWLKFRMDDEMREKYKRSKIGITDGQIRSREQYFCKNASVFDVAGKKNSVGRRGSFRCKNDGGRLLYTLRV